MTATEFRSKYVAYGWDPYHPLALILTDGRRVYIDMPEQAELGPNELVITRRSAPRKPERYRYEDIRDVVGMLDLPADPGCISYAEFDPLIRRLILQKPYRPYVLELRDGRRIPVNQPSPRHCRAVTVLGDGDQPVVKLWFDDIARVVVPEQVPSGGAA
ncbi:MAG: hypothetical protein K2X82_33595 [Gemmataceae bacterium]|nr:hypothetical protein [Gemmataceae bacterium]